MFPFFRREAKASGPMPLVALSQLGAAQWSRRDPHTLAREGYEKNAIGYRCIRMIAEAAASVALISDKADHPMAQLLARPNPDQSLPELLEAFYGHLQTAGNAYLYGATLEDGAVRELHVLRPDRMRALRGASGWPQGWAMGRGADEQRFPAPSRWFLPCSAYEAVSSQ